MGEKGSTALSVRIDGQPIGDDDARAIWERFSRHMDVNQGDFAGFAAAEGYKHASVDVVSGRPVLILGDNPPQTSATKNKRGSGGSAGNKKRRRRRGKRRKPANKG